MKLKAGERLSGDTATMMFAKMDDNHDGKIDTREQAYAHDKLRILDGNGKIGKGKDTAKNRLMVQDYFQFDFRSGDRDGRLEAKDDKLNIYVVDALRVHGQKVHK